METIIGLNDPKAVKKFSAFLAVDVPRISYFSKKFMGDETSSMPIQKLTELESDAGDTISFDLSMQLSMQPVEGDSVLEGKEENLKFYTDSIKINQKRGAVDAGGRMTRKRTIHDLRKIARARESEWWARLFDELFFIYLSGARGINNDFIYPVSYAGFAGNDITPPDSYHYLTPSASITKANMTANDKFTLNIIDRAVSHASMLGGGVQGIPKIQPIMVDGERHFVCLLNPYQEYDIRVNTQTGQWLDIQKALTNYEGKSNQIFKGGLGLYNNVVLHSHQAVIRFNDYGVGGNVEAARALFLGSQAAVLAFGSPGGGLSFGWVEQTADYDNKVLISTHTIFGVKKVAFNGLDFGVIAIDTAAKQA